MLLMNPHFLDHKNEGFWPGGAVVKAGLYARISTHEQQTLPMQIKSMREYAKRRGMDVILQVEILAQELLADHYKQHPSFPVALEQYPPGRM
jgi:hypothetical protein